MSDGLLDAAGARGVMKAAAAISAGLCDVAVVGGGLAGRFGRGQTVDGAEDFIEFTDVWGAYVIPLFALVAQGHIQRFATTAGAARNGLGDDPQQRLEEPGGRDVREGPVHGG